MLSGVYAGIFSVSILRFRLILTMETNFSRTFQVTFKLTSWSVLELCSKEMGCCTQLAIVLADPLDLGATVLNGRCWAVLPFFGPWASLVVETIKRTKFNQSFTWLATPGFWLDTSIFLEFVGSLMQRVLWLQEGCRFCSQYWELRARRRTSLMSYPPRAPGLMNKRNRHCESHPIRCLCRNCQLLSAGLHLNPSMMRLALALDPLLSHFQHCRMMCF